MADNEPKDLFDANSALESADSQETTETNEGEEGKTSTTKTTEEQPGEGEAAAGTPPAGEDGKGESATEKMIPESRLKAAVKDVSAKLEAANAKLAQYEATPVPDKATDPEGHELYMRIEASKIVMRDLVPDYDEVIAHYAKMAEANPYLNEATSKNLVPAKFAYDVAKKDLELRELAALKDDPDFKEFKEQKKAKANASTTESKAAKQVADSLSRNVPNLNRATNVSGAKDSSSQDQDDLFAGAL